MEKTGRSPADFSALAHSSTLPEVMYSLNSLANLYELGLITGTDLELSELRQYILQHIRQAIQARGACLLLYHNAQNHFVPVANQGEKLPGGMLANMLDSREIEQLTQQEPIATLTTMHIQHQHILLVTLNYQQHLIGLVALTLADEDALRDERGLLLSYLGNIAAQILYNYELRDRERQQMIEQERARIARDLHDGVVQQIAYTLHKLELSQRLIERQQSQDASTEIARATTILVESLQELRDDIAFLRPTQLHNQSFSEAIETLLNTFSTNNPQIHISRHLSAFNEVPEQLEVPLFRLLQEALANIYKHARATVVEIHFYSRAYQLIVEIHDNGIGLDTRHAPHADHIGLLNMQERIKEAGGKWQIQSKPGEGTTIMASFPILTPMTIEITQREKEVLRLIVEGLSNREIAHKLAISIDTVKTHIHHIMQKLQVKDRIQAAIVASTHRWL